jgi:nucleotide-binding universal stress UspA family protein
MAELTDGIVIGYDASLGSEEALLWAIREAKARRTTLTACLAWAPDYLVPQDEDAMRQRGEEILTQGLRYAQSQLGSANVRPAVVRGPAAHVLCKYSDTAEMVVVGHRGHGVITDQLLGSVPWQLASHGRGAVVIVRGRWRPVNNSPGPVVVGVDGSAASRAAVQFAFEEAALRGVPLFAVCAVMDAAGTLGGAGRLEEDFDRVMTAQEKEHPDVTVLRQVAPGSPRAALLTAAAEAQLLVLGARGRGSLTSMRLGSVAYVVLLHAPCPVAIVHPSGGNRR